MSYLDRIREANRYNPSDYRPFRVAEISVGHVRHEFAEHLRSWPEVFTVNKHGVALAAALERNNATAAERTAAVNGVLSQLHRDGVIINWFNESFAVSNGWGAPPLLLMERAALPFFGVRGYGVHMNGYVRRDDGIVLWVTRRARDKPTFPGKLDHLVAGGQPYGISVMENLIKECSEEAGIPRARAAMAKPAGRLRYAVDLGDGLRPDTLFLYDLELPGDFRPVNSDGEVESFYLWSLEKLSRRVRDTTDFKFNSALVIIDFLIRIGFIPKEHPQYAEIVTTLGASALGEMGDGHH